MSVPKPQPATPKPGVRWFQYSLRTLLLATLLVALFFGTNGFGVVGLHYPRVVENDPLLAPVRVLSVQNNTLHLEDGRVLNVDQLLAEGSLAESIQASDNRVDVESNGPKAVMVFIRTRGWICGTPWARPLNIRLIPDDIPINRRECIGFGTEVVSHTTIGK
jgi:hypothetical protein